MTIGPLPMIRMLLISVRLGTGGLHNLPEALEQVTGVMRTRPGLGVILHTECRVLGALQTRDAAVMEIAMRHLGVTQTLLSHGEIMILAGNLNLAGLKIFDR